LVLIHEKITALLEQRRLKKRDLARALGVSPQTATDICKGRSAITLPHLRNLVGFFEDLDRLAARGSASALARAGVMQLTDPERFLRRLRTFVQHHRGAFVAMFPDLTQVERRLLGLAEEEVGTVGRVGGAAE
jgi:transcriptional regulator with XRE-family HTH domain